MTTQDFDPSSLQKLICISEPYRPYCNVILASWMGPEMVLSPSTLFCIGFRAITHGGIFSTHCGNFHCCPSTCWLGYNVLSHFYRLGEYGWARNLFQSNEFHLTIFVVHTRPDESGVLCFVRVVIQLLLCLDHCCNFHDVGQGTKSGLLCGY